MRKAAALITVLTLLTVNVYALTVDELSYNPFDKTVNGYGTAKAGEFVTFEMINPGRYTNSEELKNEEDASASLIYANVSQTTAEAGGAYSFVFYTNAAAGTYTVRIAGQTENTVVKPLEVTEAGDVQAAIASLISAADAAAVKTAANALHLSIPETVALTNENEVYTIMKSLLASETISNTDLVKVNDIFRTSTALAAIHQASIASGQDTAVLAIFAVFEQQLALKEAEAYATYTADYLNETFRSDVRKALAGKVFASKAKLAEAFSEAVVLKGNAEVSDWEDAVTIIQNNIATLTSGANGADKLDVAAFNSLYENQKLAVANTVAKKVYGSLDAYVDAINAAITAAKSPATPQSSGNNSGGGGGIAGTFITSPLSDETAATAPVIQNRFYDLTGFEWAINSVNLLAEKGIINGTGDGFFAPGENVTREQFVKMLALAFHLEINGDADFEDVDKNAWYYPYIGAAKQAGLVNGISDTEFGIGGNITREQMATMIFRFGKYSGAKFDETPYDNFADFAAVSEYAKNAVTAMKNAEIIRGVGENKLAPHANATRAEVAHIIYITLVQLGRIEVAAQ